MNNEVPNHEASLAVGEIADDFAHRAELTGEVELATKRIDNAESAHQDIINELDANAIDPTVADYVDDATSSGDYDVAVGGAEVGAVELMRDSSSVMTARELDQTPVEVLADALKDIELVEGTEAIETVVQAIEQAAHKPAERELSETVKNAIETLRRERNRIGEQYAVSKEYIEYKETAVDRLIRDPNITPQELIALAQEQYKGRLHAESMLSEELIKDWGLDFGGERVTRNAVEGVARMLSSLDSERLKQLNDLPGKEKGFLTWIQKKYGDFMLQEDFGYDVYIRGFAKLIGADKLSELEGTRYEALLSKSNTSAFNRLDLELPLDERKYNEAYQAAARKCLEDAGIPDMLITEQLGGMRGRTHVSKSGEPMPELFNREVGRILSIVEQIGPENVQRLREEAGIMNIGELSDAQVDRMLRYINKDPILFEELDSKEVCIILRDALGDWNGAFKGVNQMFETADGATLVFELDSMKDSANDANRFIDELIANGVKPAVIVVAGHGSDRGIQLGDTWLIPSSDMTHNIDLQAGTVDMTQAGFDRLVATMKPDQDGNCSLILKSCSQGKVLTEGIDSSVVRSAAGLGKYLSRGRFHVYGLPIASSIKKQAGEYQGRETHITHAIHGPNGTFQRDTDRFRLPMFKSDDGVDFRKYESPLQEASVAEK